MTTLLYKITHAQKTIVHSLIALAVLFVVVYLYLVNSAAFNAAAQERMSDRIAEMQSRIGELELSFIEKNATIDKSLASDFGLVKADESAKIFVARNQASKLSFNE
jgi:hypothetical protein